MLRTPFDCHIICYLSVDMLHVKGTHYLNCLIALCVCRHTMQHKYFCQIVRRLLCRCRFVNWCMSVCERIWVGTDYFHMCSECLGTKSRNSQTSLDHITSHCHNIVLHFDFFAHLWSLNQKFYSLNTDLMPVCTVSSQTCHSGNAINSLPRVPFYGTT